MYVHSGYANEIGATKMLRIMTGCVLMTQSDGIHLLDCCVGI